MAAKLACATLNVRQAGGDGGQGLHRAGRFPAQQGPEAQGISELNDGGLALARALADEVAQTADEVIAGGNNHA